MKTKLSVLTIAILSSYTVKGQQFNETNSELTTTKEIVAPVIRVSNELRLANSFSPTDPSIGTLDNSGYGINIHKENGIGFALDNKHVATISPNGTMAITFLDIKNELRVPLSFSPSDPSIGTQGNSGYGINIHKEKGIGFAMNNIHVVEVKPNGNVAIQGKVEAKELKVTTSPTADFVFENDYKLPQLNTVEEFINKYKHLPEIQSAKEMEVNGVNVGEFQIQLLQKIEELTLYTIAQEKKIKALEIYKEEVQNLKKEMEELKSLIGKK